MSEKYKSDFGLSRGEIAKQREKLKANEDFLRPSGTLNMDISSKELHSTYRIGPKRKHGRKTSQWKIASRIISVLVILILGSALFAGAWGNSVISKITGGRSGIFSLINAIMNRNVDLKTDVNGRTNVLVFGTSGYEMDGSGHDGSQLTDSIMVISLGQETGDLAMINLPRDLKVDGTCSVGKVNEVYWCASRDADEEAGATALMRQVEEVFGLELQYRVHVDWGALIQIVDALGGITVTLDEDIEDTWTETYIQAGVPTTLDGGRALGLARARHGTEGGDFTRGNSQQKILMAIQEKVLQQGLDFGQALNLISAVGDNVRMDFSVEEIKTVMALSSDLSLANMRQIPLVNIPNGENAEGVPLTYSLLTTGTIDEVSYVLPVAGEHNYGDIRTYVNQQLVQLSTAAPDPLPQSE